MKISLDFIKLHQAVYEISGSTFLPLEAQIFILKTKKVRKIIISWAILTNYAFLWFKGQGIHIFTHNGEKKNKENPSN